MTVKSLEFLINVAMLHHAVYIMWMHFNQFLSPVLFFSCHFLFTDQVTSMNSKESASQGLVETMDVEGKPQYTTISPPSLHTNAQV